jgi:ubiquinone/menaquinone biosynthesis C-methylase UbiE
MQASRFVPRGMSGPIISLQPGGPGIHGSTGVRGWKRPAIPFAPLLGLLIAVAVGSARCGEPASPVAAPSAAPAGGFPEGINRDFLAPELDPAEWLARFEVESREVYAARDAVLAAIGLEPGDRIADIGSGTGLYLAPFSRAVGKTGRVYAVDISPRLVAFVEKRAVDEKLGNVAVVLSSEDSVKLPSGCVDHAFVCDAYHHFERYEAMLASIRQSLVPGGQLVVVDFERIPGVTREWLLTHVRAGKEQVREEIEKAGFEFVGEVAVKGFEENYLLRFRRP